MCVLHSRLYVCGHIGTAMHVYRLDDNFSSWFSPSTVYVPEIELRSRGFGSKCLYPLTYLVSPQLFLLNPLKESLPQGNGSGQEGYI